MSEILFVYGTLKQGWRNNCILENTGAKYLGKGTSVDLFKMYAIGFPYLLNATGKDGAHVVGEIYEVSDKTLRRCDQLESHPNFYCRTQRTFRLGEHKAIELKAWVYIYAHPERQFDDKYRVEPKNGEVEWNPEVAEMVEMEEDDA